MSAALSQIAATGGARARMVRRVTETAATEEPVALGRDRQDQVAVGSADVVVCASGNLGLISFTRHPGRLSMESIEAAYPGLLDGLIQHPGIGWVLVQSERRGGVVLGKCGLRLLELDSIEGEDPLRDFPMATARHLKRLTSYPNAADIIVNSTLYDAASGEVTAFEELIGCHGGAGGWQTRPFLLFPATWTDVAPHLEGPEAVHAFVMRHINAAMPAERRTP